MILQTDSAKLKFDIGSVESGELCISFRGESDFDIIFKDSKEKEEFVKKLLNIKKLISYESHVLLDKHFVAKETKLSEITTHYSTEEAIINKYSIKDSIVEFETNKGFVNLYLNKKVIDKLKEELSIEE